MPTLKPTAISKRGKGCDGLNLKSAHRKSRLCLSADVFLAFLEKTLMFAKNFGFNFLKVDLPFECEIHWCFPHSDLSSSAYKVFMDFSEPSTSCLPVETLLSISSKFDLILTKHESLAATLKNAHLMLFGDSFVYPWLPSLKEYSTSFLCTKKQLDLPGYRLRYELWERCNQVATPKKFYSSRREPIDVARLLPTDSKEHIFYSMFSVAIENSSEPNYFTEKVIDCFLTYTIPLYWGCSNIESYFDKDGMIFFSSIEELIDIINSLSPVEYWNRLNSLHRNYNLALQYTDLNKRLQQTILQNFLSCSRTQNQDQAIIL